MRHLKYAVIGTNLWAVERARDGQIFKIAEVALSQDRTLRLIPMATYAFTHEELKDISVFMDSAPSMGLIIQEHNMHRRPPSFAHAREEESEIERLRR
jgi:hypothetical protein